MSKKIIIMGVAVLLIGAFLWWLFTASSKSLPGQKMNDLGRKHVTSVQNSEGDLATSGDHYAEWTKAGVYEKSPDDGNLIHSLEHGYVILSHNCDKKVPSSKFQVPSVYAHDEKEETPVEQSSGSANLSEECHKLVDQLISVYEKKGKRKLIIVPRPQMSTKITLYAWNYLLKLDQFDEEKISQFINNYRDQGPEKTAE